MGMTYSLRALQLITGSHQRNSFRHHEKNESASINTIMTTILSTGQLAKLLGIPAYRIGYAHSTGALAEPDTRFLDKRCYNTADIQRVAAHFHINIDDEELKEIECSLQKNT